MKSRGIKDIIIYLLSASILVCAMWLPVFPRESDNSLLLPAVEAADTFPSVGTKPVCAARCAILIDENSGKTLFSKNADERRGMASTTKIMTALLVIENTFPDEKFTVPASAVNIEGSSVYLREGETLSVLELLYCLLLSSGNDAAVALALCVAGSTEGFAEMMNERASELGLENTHFVNPHGLTAEEHYTTASDLAHIAAEAMKYPLFREIVGTKSITVGSAENGNLRTLTNHNKFLWSYEGADGIKTGYTDAAGKCLVTCAERDGLSLIAVTLGDPFPNASHSAMLDYGFANYESVKICGGGELACSVKVVGGTESFVTAVNAEDISVCLPKGSKTEIKLEMPTFVYAPVEKGDIVAYAECVCGGSVVYIINLEATESVSFKKISFFQKIFGE